MICSQNKRIFCVKQFFIFSHPRPTFFSQSIRLGLGKIGLTFWNLEFPVKGMAENRKKKKKKALLDSKKKRKSSQARPGRIESGVNKTQLGSWKFMNREIILVR